MTTTSIISEISVVIPLYNKAAEIERTLGSVLGQSVLPREVIIIDDGSTDGSAEIVERMATPLVRLLRQENGGVSAARNRAIEMATGRWIALLDGDDWWKPDYLSAMARLIERYPDCGAYGSAFYVDNGAGLVEGDTPKCEGIVNFFEESMRRYVLIPSATILKHDLVMQLGGYPIKREGSQGQNKTYLIALKLAQFDFLRRSGHTTPILLLDDIFDRLDASRVEQIVHLVSSDTFGQIFITDVNRGHLDRILAAATGDYKLYTVSDGMVTQQLQ